MKLNFKKVAYMLPVFAATTFYSCNDEILSDDAQSKTGSCDKQQIMDERLQAVFSTNHKLSMDQAMIFAQQAEEMTGKYALKSAKLKSIADVSVLRADKNRLKSVGSPGIDTTAYIFNYENNQGFVIVGADDRIGSPIIAYIDEGNYNADSLDENQISMMSEINDYVQNSVTSFDDLKDSLEAVAIGTMNTNNLKALVIPKVEQYASLSYGPYLKTAWGQNDPYNAVIKRAHRNKNYKVGCVGVAVAQAMAYYRRPNKSKYQGITYLWDWDAMVTSKYIEEMGGNSAYQVQSLLYVVAEEIDTDFGTKSSSSTMRKAERYLDDNYNVSRSDYNADKVKKYVKAARPVIMDGHTSKSGHCWVVDGYRIGYWRLTFNNKSTNFEVEYFHHNWGWGGINNGWFKLGVFCPKGYTNESDLDIPIDLVDGNNDYSKDKQIIVFN